MKTVFIFSVILFGYFSVVQCRGVNGGMSCAACTVLVGVTMQVAEIHEENLVNAAIRLCNYLPTLAQKECLQVVSTLEPFIKNLSQEITPDMFCFVYGTCTIDLGQPFCHLFPLPFAEEEALAVAKKLENEKTNMFPPRIDVCKLPVIKDICQILDNSFSTLNAASDFDQDGFSAIATARGSDWKGKDCMDNDPEVYPGRTPFFFDVAYDSNCDGIWGIDNKTQYPWEELLCADSDPKGLIYIGDSIGAHFHMPQVWINPIQFDWPSLDASKVILDELDWPQYGFATGYKNITPNILIKGNTDSLYLRLRGRNRCNHRDYQNISKNGASSKEGILHAQVVSRNQTADKPAIVLYAMQGNDVCNNLKDTINHMTTPEDFRANVMETLRVLNTKLPKNSHVVFIGLVNAHFIYGAMAERLHPIGILHSNVRYKDVYNWFNCMQIGPCTGWLNSNETLRNITTERAIELTNILKDIAKHEKFEFFDLHFVDNPVNYAVEVLKVNVPDLLEAVDSLHPNQRAQPMLTDVVWTSLTKLPTDILGPVNKNNKLIKTLFGNQGGH